MKAAVVKTLRARIMAKRQRLADDALARTLRAGRAGLPLSRERVMGARGRKGSER